MQIRFKFDLLKSLHAMAYLVDRLGSMDKIKLIKLLYIADRDHFLEHGHPITGDRQCAMRHGPVPSQSLDALGGESLPNPKLPFEYLHIDDNRVMLQQKPTGNWLMPEEEQTLDNVLAQYGQMGTWELRDLTHTFQEWKDSYVENTSTTIPYELMLRHYKGEEGFRHGRPVLTESINRAMIPPFIAADDSDL